MRSVMQDIEDLWRYEEHKEEVDLESLQREIAKQEKREIFNNYIHKYLIKNKISIAELDKDWLNDMLRNIKEKDRKQFIDQVMNNLQVHYWKALDWIRENNKSPLLSFI